MTDKRRRRLRGWLWVVLAFCAVADVAIERAATCSCWDALVVATLWLPIRLFALFQGAVVFALLFRLRAPEPQRPKLGE
jgi:hypothetical protein